MPAMPMPAPTPVDLFRLEVIDLVAGDDGGFSRQSLISGERLRRQWRGLGAGGEHGRTRGNANGDFQKVTAFHDISLQVNGA